MPSKAVQAYDNDTDYLGISYIDYFLARYFLYTILTDKSFMPQKNSPVGFIKLSDEQLKRLLDVFNKDNNDA